MKRFIGVLVVLVSLFVGSLGWLSLPQQAIAANINNLAFRSTPVLAVELRNTVDAKRVELGDRIDLNNTNVRAFTKYPGMYPTLASMIIRNAPFGDVDDVLKMPGLSEKQKDVLQSYMDQFVVTNPEDALTEGGDRFNNGIYGG